jgi:hypothetical protein
MAVDCCMARHANATPPWTCDCSCHTAPVVEPEKRKVFLVVFADEPSDIQTAWETRAEAQWEIDRQLSKLTGSDFYYVQNRLNIVELPVGMASPLQGAQTR